MSKVRTTLILDEDLLRRAKKQAVDEGTTLTELVDRGIRMAVHEKVAPYVVRLPSHGEGGLLPGIDLENKDQIEEIELGDRLW